MIGTVSDGDDIFAVTANNADDRLMVPYGMSLTEARARSEREREDMDARFRAAPFPLYGLPPSWVSGRFLGGGEWGDDGRRERISALSLVHGVLVAGEGPELIVETSTPQSVGGGRLANAAGMV